MLLSKLYAEMASLTSSQCKKDCSTIELEGHIGGCCGSMYCRIAKNICEKQGGTPPEFFTVDGEPTYLNPDGTGCIMPPHFRPMCTLHICEKSLMWDKKFSKKYFKLREKINQEEFKCNPMLKKLEKSSGPTNKEKDEK